MPQTRKRSEQLHLDLSLDHLKGLIAVNQGCDYYAAQPRLRAGQSTTPVEQGPIMAAIIASGPSDSH